MFFSKVEMWHTYIEILLKHLTTLKHGCTLTHINMLKLLARKVGSMCMQKLKREYEWAFGKG